MQKFGKVPKVISAYSHFSDMPTYIAKLLPYAPKVLAFYLYVGPNSSPLLEC